MARKEKITKTYAEWQAILDHMQNVSDPYFMKTWLADCLQRHEGEETITLPAYGCGADFIHRVSQ